MIYHRISLADVTALSALPFDWEDWGVFAMWQNLQSLANFLEVNCPPLSDTPVSAMPCCEKNDLYHDESTRGKLVECVDVNMPWIVVYRNQIVLSFPLKNNNSDMPEWSIDNSKGSFNSARIFLRQYCMLQCNLDYSFIFWTTKPFRLPIIEFS